jgi:hypothetical protein
VTGKNNRFYSSPFTGNPRREREQRPGRPTSQLGQDERPLAPGRGSRANVRAAQEQATVAQGYSDAVQRPHVHHAPHRRRLRRVRFQRVVKEQVATSSTVKKFSYSSVIFIKSTLNLTNFIPSQGQYLCLLNTMFIDVNIYTIFINDN